MDRRGRKYGGTRDKSRGRRRERNIVTGRKKVTMIEAKRRKKRGKSSERTDKGSEREEMRLCRVLEC